MVTVPGVIHPLHAAAPPPVHAVVWTVAKSSDVNRPAVAHPASVRVVRSSASLSALARM